MSGSSNPRTKAIQAYYQTLKAYGEHHVAHESALHSAFHHLLAETAKTPHWVLVHEHTRVTPAGLFAEDRPGGYDNGTYRWKRLNAPKSRQSQDKPTCWLGPRGRLNWDVGGQEYLMAALIEAPPYFHALAVFVCKRNRLYRIYIRPDELVFIWAGTGAEGLAGVQAAEVSYGLLGALIGKAAKSVLDPTMKNLARREVLDQTGLELLIDGNPNNLRAPINEFEEVRIEPRTDRHARIYSDHGHQALLHLRHRSLGKYRLGIASVKDVQIALAELPRVLGEVFRVEVEWPEREQKCWCKFCRVIRDSS